MPISDEALQNAKNRFIAVKGEATVGQAIAALQQEGGEAWWHLVVQMDDGSWGVARFSELHSALVGTVAALEIRLGSWPGLIRADAVEQAGMETKAAVALAKQSDARMLVVTEAGLPKGILVESVMRSAAAITSARLGELGGKYVNLKDYGSILLSSSRSTSQPKPATPTESARS